MKKRTLALVLSAITLLLCTGLAACGGKDTPKDTEPSTENVGVATQGKFVVGFDATFPPMGFQDDNGDYVGFDLELAKEVAARLNLEFVPRPIEWETKDQEINAGTIDCIWNGFTMTGREDAYTWSEPYVDNEQVIVVLKDSAVASIDDLKGKTVCVQTDSSAETALNNKPEVKSTFKKVTAVDNYENALLNLKSGTCDAILMDVVVAEYKVKTLDGAVKIVGEPFSSEKYGIGFKKGNTVLRDKVQETLDAMAKDGTIAKISNKWFGRDITTLGKN